MALTLPCGIENTSDGGGEALPFGGFAHELFAAGGSERVEAGFAIVGGDAPLGGDPAAVFEALERGIESAMLDEQFLPGSVLNSASDALAVLLAEDESAQDEQVERALQEFEAFFIVLG
jgi:hypothetical protein